MSVSLVRARTFVAAVRQGSTDRLILCVLILLSAIVWLPRLNGPIDLRWDAGAYYVLGTSLAEGRGYRLLNEPGDIEAIQYPPGLAIVIAIHQLALGTSDPHRVGHVLRFTFALVFILFILTSYLVLRRFVPTAYAFVAVLIALVNPTTIVMSDFCLSDLPFALISTLFFLLQQRSNRRVVRALMLFTALAAFTMRSAGLALLVAWVAESLFDGRKKEALFRLGVCLLPVVGWQYYVHRVEAGPQFRHPTYQYQREDYMYYNTSYARNTSLVAPFVPQEGHLTAMTMTTRVVRNVIRMPRTLGETVSARLDYWRIPFQALGKDSTVRRGVSLILHQVPIAFGFLILGGIALQLMRHQWLIPFYILLSLMIICLTPFQDMFTRYMIPLTPFVALSLFEAVIWLKRKSERASSYAWRAAGYISVASVTSLCLLQAPFYLKDMYSLDHKRVAYQDRQGRLVEYRLFFYDRYSSALDAGIEWLNSHATSSDIVAVSMPHWVYLRTGLKTVMPPFEPHPARLEALLDSVPVKYAVLDGTLYRKPADTSQYVAPAVHNAPERWGHVYSSQDGSCEIYERLRSR